VVIGCGIVLKILLLEYITAGGLNDEPLQASLLQEGTLMRDALLRDFSDIAEVEIVTTYDVRVSLPKFTKQAICVDSTSDIKEIWHDMLQTCDAALLVAPESNGVLTELTAMIEVAGVKNLGCLHPAVEIASNKQLTCDVLKKANILTIPTYTVYEFLSPDFISTQSVSSGWVIKPIDGAGCVDTFYFTDGQALKTWLILEQTIEKYDAYIIQPYQHGTPASISMLCKNGRALVLSCNEQVIEIEASEIQVSKTQTTKNNPASIQYKGSKVNALSHYNAAFAELANQITTAIPDLNGYVGVDLIIHEQGDFKEIFVVEINSRITTSYIALRESIDCNPAKLILDLVYDNTSSLAFNLPENMARKTIEIRVNG
jgi:predicted ATP-grasp superfamily ATP-dependent carboligase